MGAVRSEPRRIQRHVLLNAASATVLSFHIGSLTEEHYDVGVHAFWKIGSRVRGSIFGTECLFFLIATVTFSTKLFT